MSNYPAVGIGILNWNGKKYLEQFLPAVLNNAYPNFTVYVIDNKSTDDSIVFLKEQFPQVQIIETGNNLGFAEGYNVGFAQMPEPYLLMMNSDIEPSKHFLQPLVEQMEQKPQLGAVQSKLLSYHQKDSFEYGGACGGSIDLLGYKMNINMLLHLFFGQVGPAH
jgi:GT2 family glycosyltransferase